jgi:hypothetical protein
VQITTFILAIYIGFLAMFPCCLVDQCPDDRAQSQQAAGHRSGDADCGTCSPFFNCGACASATVNVEAVYPAIIASAAESVYTSLPTVALRDVSYDFWQPPRKVLE